VTTGTSVAVDVSGYRDLSIYLAGSGTINAGTLIVEEADYNVTGPDYIMVPPATWSAVTGSNPLACTEVTGGLQKAYQLPPGAYAYIRVRVGTTVSGGGSITVSLRGI
jgi:hypothetical protein